jgi:FlaA1/EpsC-like NDP-sugar epimerase
MGAPGSRSLGARAAFHHRIRPLPRAMGEAAGRVEAGFLEAHATAHRRSPTRSRTTHLKPTDILLTDQVAVITGGGGGIGRAIALAYAAVGADIVIADIVPERCEETAARVRELGRRALGVPTDVTHTDQIRALIDAATRNSAASTFW